MKKKATKTEDMAEVAQAVRQIPIAEPGRFGEVSFARNVFHYHAMAGSVIEDFLRKLSSIAMSLTHRIGRIGCEWRSK